MNRLTLSLFAAAAGGLAMYWLDPDAGFCGVLLTNRVHKTREHIAIRAARPAAYDAMFDALKQDR